MSIGKCYTFRNLALGLVIARNRCVKAYDFLSQSRSRIQPQFPYLELLLYCFTSV
jgi:hypothetical protein